MAISEWHGRHWCLQAYTPFGWGHNWFDFAVELGFVDRIFSASAILFGFGFWLEVTGLTP